MPIICEPLGSDVTLPERSTEHSAGYDLRAYLEGRRVRVYRHAIDRFVEEPSHRVPDADAGGGSSVLLLEAGDRALIPTGFRARLPEGVEGQIRVRSSVAWKKGLEVPNAPGTIDPDYPDEWLVLIHNASGRTQRIEHGERIAQVVLARYEVLEWREGEVGVSTDRTGGLGSTGC